MKKQTVNFGLGYRVKVGAKFWLMGGGSYYSRLADYASRELGEKSTLEAFEVNAGDYANQGVFIVLKDPFKLGANLLGPAMDLEVEIRRMGLSTVGKFGEVGGLYVEVS